MKLHTLRIISTSVLLSSANLVFAASPMFTILPSTLALTTRSDGGTSILYSVTNNLTHTFAANLKIDPYYHSNAAFGSLTLQNDTCSGSTLAPKASCQFGIVISGAQQANSFTITPAVCKGSQLACSTVISSDTLTVNVDQVTQDPYAYFSIMPTEPPSQRWNIPNGSELLPINAIDNSFGTAVTGLFLADVNGNAAIAVALDGTKVYAVETFNNNGNYSAKIAVLSAGADSHLLQTIALPDTGTNNAFAIAIAPNGKTLYVSATDNGDTNAVYSIDLPTQRVTTLPEVFARPSSLAISPDGSRLYVANYGPLNHYGYVSVINAVTNTLVASLTDAIYNPNGIVISPDGATLYVSDTATPSITSYTIASNDTYVQNTIIDSNNNSAMSISSDGNYLYVSNTYDSNIKQFNTHQLNQPISLSTSNPINAGIALTPNNTSLFTVPMFGNGVSLKRKNVHNELDFLYPGIISALPLSSAFTLLNGLSNINCMPQYGNFVG